MDFSWNDEQQQLHEQMRALGEPIMAAAATDRLGRLAEHGVLGLSIDSSYGGGGWDLVSTAYAYEGLGATLADGGTLLAAGAHLFGVALAIQAVGTPAQRERWLPALAAGQRIGTVAATEKHSGSNMGAIKAVVEPAGDGLLAQGDKCFVTNAPGADLFLFVGRHGATGRGLTVALVEADAPGVKVGAPLQTAGLKSAQLAPVAFEGCQLSIHLSQFGCGCRPSSSLSAATLFPACFRASHPGLRRLDAEENCPRCFGNLVPETGSFPSRRCFGSLAPETAIFSGARENPRPRRRSNGSFQEVRIICNPLRQ